MQNKNARMFGSPAVALWSALSLTALGCTDTEPVQEGTVPARSGLRAANPQDATRLLSDDDTFTSPLADETDTKDEDFSDEAPSEDSEDANDSDESSSDENDSDDDEGSRDDNVEDDAFTDDTAVSTAPSTTKSKVVVPTGFEIVVDGDASDWKSVPVAAKGAYELKVTSDDESLYLLLQGSNIAQGYQWLFDSDGDPATGASVSVNPWAASGADHLLETGFFYRHDDSTKNNGWKWSAALPSALFQAQRALDGSAYEFKIARSELGSLPPQFGLVYRDPQDTTRTVPSDAFWRTAPAYERRGVIIPAYIGLADKVGWDALADGAKTLNPKGSTQQDDYWVVLNGADSGPQGIDKDLAKTRWEPVQANGGKLFGYVHTCVNKQRDQPDSFKFRTPEEVLADVKGWLVLHPELEGIWLDEFYPLYEIRKTSSAPIDFPNGFDYAPTDQASATDTTRQVDPTGGYYERLIGQIRKLKPGLRIIGNVGARLESNQLRYAALVDVVCSFEKNLKVTLTAPSHSDPGLLRQTLRPTYGQLALIHGNTNMVEEALKLALEQGYSHVYTTDVIYTGEATGSANVWGSIPSYLPEQLKRLKKLLHP